MTEPTYGDRPRSSDTPQARYVLRYTRVAKKGDSTVDSCARQRAMLDRYAEEHQLVVLADFIDEVSAWKKPGVLGRPGFAALVDAVSAGEYDGKRIDGVLCHHVDRLTRNAAVAIDFFRRLRVNGLKLFTLTEGEQSLHVEFGVSEIMRRGRCIAYVELSDWWSAERREAWNRFVEVCRAEQDGDR
jgi:hypothetical protein